MKRSITVVFLFMLVLFNTRTIHALSVETHEKINENVAQMTLTGFSLNTYLINNIGLEKGVNESFNSFMAWEWISKGGHFEDKPPWTVPYLRSFNHFHDPLVPLANAGYWPGESAILWSQQDAGSQWIGGYYSWHDARKYFYNALTLTDKTSRDTNFAEMFRGVGQLMHLVQDMSVPEHSRNDVELGRQIV
jgi:hypothetical protein